MSKSKSLAVKDELEFNFKQKTWSHFFATAMSVVKSKYNNDQLRDVNKIELMPNKILIHVAREREEE